MPQWGANTNNESKPKNLTAEEKSRVFADTRGWVITRQDGTEEVLVAIRNLSEADKLAGATIQQEYFTANSYSTGATGTVRVVWNEKIRPTTTGTMVIARSDTSATLTATRSGNNTARNFVNFTFTVPATTGITLTIPAQTISMGINDAGSTTVTSDLTIVLAEVDAANVDGGSTSVVTTI
jgi:hypothetical protein